MRTRETLGTSVETGRSRLDAIADCVITICWAKASLMIDLGGSWPREQAVNMTANKHQRQIWRNRRSIHRVHVRTMSQACRRCISLSKQAKDTDEPPKTNSGHDVAQRTGRITVLARVNEIVNGEKRADR